MNSISDLLFQESLPVGMFSRQMNGETRSPDNSLAKRKSCEPQKHLCGK